MNMLNQPESPPGLMLIPPPLYLDCSSVVQDGRGGACGPQQQQEPLRAGEQRQLDCMIASQHQ